jgi:hypothetical protein
MDEGGMKDVGWRMENGGCGGWRMDEEGWRMEDGGRGRSREEGGRPTFFSEASFGLSHTILSLGMTSAFSMSLFPPRQDLYK